MPTLDFVRDICDVLRKQDIDFYIIAIQKNSKGEPTRADTFAQISNQQTASILEKNFDDVKENIQKSRKKTKKASKKK